MRIEDGTSDPALDTELVAVPFDLGGLSAREVTGEDERVRIRGAGENLPAGASRLLRVLTEAAVPMRFHDLHRIVHDVTNEYRAIRARRDVEYGTSRSVTGSRDQGEVLVDGEATAPQVRLPRIVDRRDAVLVGILIDQCTLGLLFVERVPELEVCIGEEVGGVREGRNPLAVLQHGVPADMIQMEVRADHNIDVRWIYPLPRQILQVDRIELRHGRDVGPLFAVSTARIDQNILPGAAQQVRGDSGVNFFRLRVPVGGHERRAVPLPILASTLRYEQRRNRVEVFRLRNTSDGHITQGDWLHRSSSSRVARSFHVGRSRAGAESARTARGASVPLRALQVETHVWLRCSTQYDASVTTMTMSSRQPRYPVAVSAQASHAVCLPVCLQP